MTRHDIYPMPSDAVLSELWQIPVGNSVIDNSTASNLESFIARCNVSVQLSEGY